MDKKTIENSSVTELIRLYRKQRTKEYNARGIHHVKYLRWEDIPFRILSGMADSIILLFPIFLWMMLFLLILSAILSFNILTSLDTFLFIMICIHTLIIQPLITVYMKGQSLGKVIYRFKIVGTKGRELKDSVLFIREFIGKSLPIILLYSFLGIFGVLIFIVINFVILLVDRKHRIWIDFILKSIPVYLEEYDKTEKTLAPVTEKVKEPVQDKYEGKYIDLHLHSLFSDDGTYNVEELFQMAVNKKMKVISITDHNSVKANAQAENLSKIYQVDYIPGVEFDANYKGLNIKILGYFIDYRNEMFSRFENENLAKERAVSKRRIELFEQCTGIQVDENLLLSNNKFQVVTGEMIAEYVLSREEYYSEKILEPYIHGNKKKDPYANLASDFFSYGKPAFVDIVYPSAEDVISMIHASGGVAILSHPLREMKQNPSFIKELLENGADGLEIFTSYHDERDISLLLKLATHYKCSITAGSDFHGVSKPAVYMGKTNCSDDARRLVERFINKYKN